MDEEETVAVLAGRLGVVVPPEFLAEVAAAWRLMAPHLERVRDAELGPEAEPASLFRP